MTIGKKLMGGFTALLLCVFALSYFSLSAVGNLRGLLEIAEKNTAHKLDLSGTIARDVSQMRAEVRGVVLSAMLKNMADVELYKGNFAALVAETHQVLTDIQPILTTDRGRKDVGEMETNLAAWVQTFAETTRLCEEGHVDEAMRIRKERELPVAKAMEEGAADILTISRHQLEESEKSSVDEATAGRWAIVVCIGCSLLVGVIMLFVVQNVNRRLRQTASELAVGAEEVASAARQLSASSQSLAQGSSEQAASLEETSASSEEISSMARKNSENSGSAVQLVTQSQEKFTQTNHSLDQMVVAMGEITSHSDKISRIIKVIDEIAFQTNILALNAAVEAARAGEAGMGFAVVADEVRNLAQRCAQAARDTAELIEESITKSNDGKTKVDLVAAAIRTITGESAQVKTLVDEVNLGSQEQTRGIEQIGKAIRQMELVTQKTAANAEESAAASEELTAQSATLNHIVERLGSLVGGQEDDRHRAARKSVAQPPAKSKAPEPLVFVQQGLGKDPFPMDDEFKDS